MTAVAQRAGRLHIGTCPEWIKVADAGMLSPEYSLPVAPRPGLIRHQRIGYAGVLVSASAIVTVGLGTPRDMGASHSRVFTGSPANSHRLSPRPTRSHTGDLGASAGGT